MKVEIKDGKLYIELPISERTSASGKSTIIASTGGNKPTEAQYNGKVVIVRVNAYIQKG